MGEEGGWVLPPWSSARREAERTVSLRVPDFEFEEGFRSCVHLVELKGERKKRKREDGKVSFGGRCERGGVVDGGEGILRRRGVRRSIEQLGESHSYASYREEREE